MKIRKYPALLSLLATLAVGAVLAGCDDTLSTFDDRRGFYSIYGALDMDKEVNYIRVKDLSEPLEEGAGRDLQVEVTLENLDRQETEVLEDSVIVFEGVYTHNFRTRMTIRSGERYRLRVEGAEGASTEANMRAPHRTEPRMEPVAPTCTTSVELIFENVPDPSNLNVSVGFQLQNTLFQHRYFPEEGGDPDEVTVEFTPKTVINNSLEEEGIDVWCHNLSSDSLYVNFTHYSPNFFENIAADTVDVPGGASRFGAMYDKAVRFPLDTVNVCTPICPPRNPVNPD